MSGIVKRGRNLELKGGRSVVYMPLTQSQQVAVMEAAGNPVGVMKLGCRVAVRGHEGLEVLSYDADGNPVKRKLSEDGSIPHVRTNAFGLIASDDLIDALTPEDRAVIYEAATKGADEELLGKSVPSPVT